MVATVKIIPFAAPAEAVERCVEAAAAEGPLLRVAPFQHRAVGLIQTRLPGLKESILDKTREVTEAGSTALGCRLVARGALRPRSADLAALIRDAFGHGIEMVLIAGASAILDRRDVIPAAIVAAGGRVDHFGMPVDPGNLLLLGHVGERVGAGPARLRPLAEGQRLRLGAASGSSPDCRSARPKSCGWAAVGF